MSYDVTYRGEPLATIANSSPKGKSVFTTDLYYDVICEEKDLEHCLDSCLADYTDPYGCNSRQG